MACVLFQPMASASDARTYVHAYNIHEIAAEFVNEG